MSNSHKKINPCPLYYFHVYLLKVLHMTDFSNLPKTCINLFAFTTSLRSARTIPGVPSPISKYHRKDQLFSAIFL